MSRSLVRPLTLVLVLASILALPTRRAEAGIGTSPSGIYHGFFQSSLTPGRGGTVEFAITTVRNQRFFGMVTMIDGATNVQLPTARGCSLSSAWTGSVIASLSPA
jgi:hypothetical protein